MTNRETIIQPLIPKLCGCDEAVKTNLNHSIDAIFPKGLLEKGESILPDNLTIQSLMFGLPIVFYSPHGVKLLDANSRWIKVAQIGNSSPTYEVLAYGAVAVETVKVNRDGLVSERSITVKQTSPTHNDVDTRLVAVRQASFNTQPVVARPGKYPFKSFVIFVGLEANLNNQRYEGFVLIP